MTTVDAAVGTWIAEHVLTPTYLRACGSLAHIRSCACQGGPSGYCHYGDCARCAHATAPEWYADPLKHTETYVVGRRGGALAAVYVEGPRCQWHCSCACHRRRYVPVDDGGLFALADAGPIRRRGKSGPSHHIPARTPSAPTLDLPALAGEVTG